MPAPRATCSAWTDPTHAPRTWPSPSRGPRSRTERGRAAAARGAQRPSQGGETMQTRLKTERSTALFEQSERVFPGGVNSPVRAFKSVGGQPLFIKRGWGSHVEDEDGNQFLDYLGSWGPLILGHTHPRVVRAI